MGEISKSVIPKDSTHIDDLGECLKFEDNEWFGLSRNNQWCKITAVNFKRMKQHNLRPITAKDREKI